MKAIIFDLDDTLIDTYSQLITPLENSAAIEMIKAGSQEREPQHLTNLLLKLRRENPSYIEKILLKDYPSMDSNILDVRRRIFSNINLDQLTIAPEVEQMIQDLSERYTLYLVTSGETEFQNRKIDHLKIRGLFHKVFVLDSRSNRDKKSLFKKIRDLFHKVFVLDSRSYRDKKSLFKFIIKDNNYSVNSVFVVGNRIDNEICAGNKLGLVTVWVNYGEGSEIKLEKKIAQPDYTIKNIIQLREILTRFESHFKD